MKAASAGGGLAPRWIERGLGFVAGCLFMAALWVLAPWVLAPLVRP
jgi:hypothetical protein